MKNKFDLITQIAACLFLTVLLGGKASAALPYDTIAYPQRQSMAPIEDPQPEPEAPVEDPLPQPVAQKPVGQWLPVVLSLLLDDDSVAGNSAVVENQSVPSVMVAGRSYEAAITLRNNGSTTWQPSENFRLVSAGPANSLWSGSVAPTVAVTPGQSYTFRFVVAAPTVAGSYNFQARMIKGVSELFGDATPNLVVNVEPPRDVATVLAQQVPSTMVSGHTYTVALTYNNAGNTVWEPNQGYRLGSQNPSNNAVWGGAVVGLERPVAPGESYTFQFNVVAPASGTYQMQWQMWNGKAWFGVASLSPTLVGTVSELGMTALLPALPKTLTRTESFEYYPSTGQLFKKIAEPYITQSRVDTQYTYDRFGNVETTITSSPATGTAAITPRSSRTSYDARGQFAVGGTNALNQTESRSFDARSGQMTSATDINQITASAEYDEFGRKTWETRPDGTKTKWEYAYCAGVASGSVVCPAYAAYMVQITPYGTDGNVSGPWTKVYYTALDKEVKSETVGFDGSTTIVVSTEYDSQGRVRRKSRPYYSGQTAQWTTTSYDRLNRVSETVQPDNSSVRVDYDGLTTTTTNSIAQTKKEIKDPLGRVSTIIDNANNRLSFIYDGFDQLLRTTDAKGNIVQMVYDVRGNKVGLYDPDLGIWSYEYDVMGNLTRQTDAKNQVTTIAYDLLNRRVQRSERDLISTWTFDTCPKGIGKLCVAAANNGYKRSLTFDALGRESGTETTISSTDAKYATSVAYDPLSGRLATVRYPNALAVTYLYTQLGYLREVRNASTNALYWQANKLDAENNLLQQTYGNGVATVKEYDPVTGRLKKIFAGANNSVQNLSFDYNTVGNVTSRNDANQNLSESFYYEDGLNRLTKSRVSSPVAGTVEQTYAYDEIGNIKTRSGVGTYAYGGTNAKPHALTTVTLAGGGTIEYLYDENGNLYSEVQKDAGKNVIATKGRTESYTSFNMPLNMSAPGGISLNFLYGPEHQRTKLVSNTGTTIYLNPDQAGGLLYENETKSDGTVEHRNFVTAAGQVVALVKQVGSTMTVSYLHRDNLGSTTAITNEGGSVVERLMYEPFGKRRFASGSSDPGNTIAGGITKRGFTNHEHLDSLGLIHMNGRVYDPALGRFMSADPNIPEPTDMQSFNRYSYVRNNPLLFVDMTGFYENCYDGSTCRNPAKGQNLPGPQEGERRGGLAGDNRRKNEDGNSRTQNDAAKMPGNNAGAKDSANSGTPAGCRTGVDCGGNGNGYDQKDPLYHRYTVNSGICNEGTPGCTVENVATSVKKNAAPGSDGVTSLKDDDKTAIVFMGISGGHVTHIVDDKNKRVLNITDSDHVFYNGLVIRSVVKDGGTVYVSSFGEGVNKPNLGWLPNALSKVGNLITAYPGFKFLDGRIQRDILNQSPQGQQILQQQQIRRLEGGYHGM